MLYNRRIDRALLVLVPVALFVYESTRPMQRLKTEMPAEFAESSATGKQKAAQTQLAGEYWNVVLAEIQWRYTYGSPLPDTPPDGFRLLQRTAPGPEPLAASRFRYWHRLQQIWLKPESWETSREWSTQWLTEPIMQAGNWLDQSVAALMGRL